MIRLLVVLLSCLPVAASAATVCVNPAGSGGCFPKVQQGVDAAVSGDVVDVAAGTYLEHVVVAAGKRIRLKGAGSGSSIIDGGGVGTVLKIKSPNRGMSVEGVGIRNGRRGIAFGDHVKIDISDCAITGNVGGSGVRGSGTNVTVTRCTITGNSSTDWGGGIAIVPAPRSSPRLKVISSLIRDNTAAASGGGIAVQVTGRLALTGSTVDDNSAGESGGGVFAFDLVVDDSTISRNQSLGSGTSPFGRGGGGIHALGNVTIRNTTISGNTTTSTDPSRSSPGGGLHAASLRDTGGRLVLEHVTVANNTSDGAGGGISSDSKLVKLKAALIGDNVAPTSSDCFSAAGVTAFRANLIEDPTSCGVRPSRGGIVVNADPKLGPLQDNGGATETQALLAGSPAIGVVTAAALCQAPDQRGVARSVPCDLGSFEAP